MESLINITAEILSLQTMLVISITMLVLSTAAYLIHKEAILLLGAIAAISSILLFSGLAHVPEGATVGSLVSLRVLSRLTQLQWVVWYGVFAWRLHKNNPERVTEIWTRIRSRLY